MKCLPGIQQYVSVADKTDALALPIAWISPVVFHVPMKISKRDMRWLGMPLKGASCRFVPR